jgi:hypothetical protein
MSDNREKSYREFESKDGKVQLSLECSFPQTDEGIENTLRNMNPDWIPLFEATCPSDEYYFRVQRIKEKILKGAGL